MLGGPVPVDRVSTMSAGLTRGVSAQPSSGDPVKSAQVSFFSIFPLSFTCLFTVLSLLLTQPTHDFGVPGITSPTLRDGM